MTFDCTYGRLNNFIRTKIVVMATNVFRTPTRPNFIISFMRFEYEGPIARVRRSDHRARRTRKNPGVMTGSIGDASGFLRSVQSRRCAVCQSLRSREAGE